MHRVCRVSSPASAIRTCFSPTFRLAPARFVAIRRLIQLDPVGSELPFLRGAALRVPCVVFVLARPLFPAPDDSWLPIPCVRHCLSSRPCLWGTMGGGPRHEALCSVAALRLAVSGVHAALRPRRPASPDLLAAFPFPLALPTVRPHRRRGAPPRFLRGWRRQVLLARSIFAPLWPRWQFRCLGGPKYQGRFILARAEAAAPADEAYRRAILVRGPGTFVFDGLTDSLLLSVLGAVFPVSQRLALRAVGSLARRGAVPDPSPSPASRRA